MVNVLGAVVSSAASIFSGTFLVKPTYQGNDPLTGEGPYDSVSKRAGHAAIAAMTGITALAGSPLILPSATEPSAIKTGVAIATLALITPSAIRNIYKGDEKRAGTDGREVTVGPYTTLKGRAIGHLQEGAVATALAYLAYNNPEIAYTILSTTASVSWGSAKMIASTALTIGKGAASIASYASNGVAAARGLFSAGFNAVFGSNEAEL